MDTVEEEGYDRGIEEGIHKEIHKVAKNLLNNNVSIEIIMKATGLTKTQIEHLNN